MDFCRFIWMFVGIGLALSQTDDNVKQSKTANVATAWMISGTQVTEIHESSTSLPSEECVKFVTEDKAKIRSPDYPYYKSHQSCTYLLLAPKGQVINVDFTEFSLEYYPSCAFDYLEFYDGGFESSDRLGKFCGNIRPPTVTSSSNVLLVKFHSDGSVNKLGFEATVTHSKETWVTETVAPETDASTIWRTSETRVTGTKAPETDASTIWRTSELSDKHDVTEIVTDVFSMSATEKQEATYYFTSGVPASDEITTAPTSKATYYFTSGVPASDEITTGATSKATSYFTSGVPASDEITTGATSKVSVCPNGWYQFGEFCYFTKTSLGDFLDAKRYCKTHGGKVACIHSEEEQEFVMSLLTFDVDSYFIGMRMSDERQTWQCTDETEITFVNFIPGKPDGHGDEDCVELLYSNDGKWDDVSCRFPFNGAICKANFDDVSVTEVTPKQIPSISECQDGWTRYRVDQSYCLMTKGRKWSSASRKCNAIGGHLLQIEDSLENGFISSLMANTNLNFVWLGMTDEVEEGIWMTDDNRPVSQYRNWDSWEPNNNYNEDCAVMFVSFSDNLKHGSWHDNPCCHEFAFICEK